MDTTVNFEIAKLLKEKGFIQPTYWYYTHKRKSPTNEHTFYPDLGKPENWNDDKNFKFYERFSAPTVAEVIMWLYGRYNIWIAVTSISQESWQCHMTKKGDSLGKCYLEDFYEPTEAYEAAITHILNHLI